MANDSRSDLIMFGGVLVVLAASFAALYYLFPSFWIILLGLIAGAVLVVAFGLLDDPDSAPQHYAKASLDRDERGWRRFDRRAA